jgi:transposase
MSSFSNTSTDPTAVVPRMSEKQRATHPSRRRFGAEFKADAVRLVTEHGYTHKAAADAIGVSDGTLSGWVCEARAVRGASSSSATSTPAEGATLEQLQAENRLLRKKLAEAQMERDILKKATAYFAKEST